MRPLCPTKVPRHPPAAADSTQSGPLQGPGDVGPGSVLLAQGCDGHQGAKREPDHTWISTVVGWRSPWAQGQNQSLGRPLCLRYRGKGRGWHTLGRGVAYGSPEEQRWGDDNSGS